MDIRHNVLSVPTLSAFLRIRGGLNRGVRDVYFVRALGECPDLKEQLAELDRMGRQETAAGRMVYLRVSALPKMFRTEDAAFYGECCRQWEEEQTVRLRTPLRDPDLQPALNAAFRRVLESYHTARPQASATMVRNFQTKLLFWTDALLRPALETWTERCCVKIVAEDIQREQEYLFCYLATLLGMDVLLLNHRANTDTGESLKSLSVTLQLGSYGNTALPAFEAQTPAQPSPAPRQTAPSAQNSAARPNIPATQTPTAETGPASQSSASQGNVRVVLPPREDRRPRTSAPAEQGNAPRSGRTSTAFPSGTAVPPSSVSAASNQTAPVRAEAPQPQPAPAPAQPKPAPAAPKKTASSQKGKKAQRKKKTYEELARLASSIVMIFCLNGDGEIQGTGSGIMIGAKGFILTNCHVIRDARAFAVRVENDEKAYLTSDVIKYSPNMDLAVIRIDRRLKPLPIYSGKKKPVRGERVMAIGSPKGLFNSVSDGIIAGFRNMDEQEMIQFTAPISPGSSGGALLNMYGEVIGISSAGIDDGQNLNLAVSYQDILPFIRGLT